MLPSGGTWFTTLLDPIISQSALPGKAMQEATDGIYGIRLGAVSVENFKVGQVCHPFSSLAALIRRLDGRVPGRDLVVDPLYLASGDLRAHTFEIVVNHDSYQGTDVSTWLPS